MSTKRPSYVRADTDISLQDNVGGTRDSDPRKSKIETLFPKEFDAEDKTKSEIFDKGIRDGSGSERDNDLPVYDEEQDTRRGSVVVSTAEDLVTRIINVEDDPTMDPWTFRTFFLGTSQDEPTPRDKPMHFGMSDDSLLS